MFRIIDRSQHGRRDCGRQAPRVCLDGVIAGLDLSLAGIKEREILLEGKDQFGAVMPPVNAARLAGPR
jgi:hypothetical protein